MNLRLPHLATWPPAYLAFLLALAACDAGITGEAAGNQAPETELAVRVTDLRETLGDGTLTSTVEVHWSGTDPDGFVAGYELRYYDASRLGEIGPEEGWIATTRRDTTVTLPIPPGDQTAAVAFEVRAIDDDGAKDPEPARTVFPIRNSPPTLRLSGVEVPPDTTWPAASFTWAADDPDGAANLLGVEIALTDTTAGFLRLPADVDFVTLVAADPRATETTARVLIGTSGIDTGLALPGFRLDADNTVYLRSVDAAEFTSRTARYPDPDAGQTWFVRRVTAGVLLVNDYRTANHTVVMPYHRDILASYGAAFDEWYLAEPFHTGSTIVSAYSENLPKRALPTLRETLRFWDHVYWVSNNATNRAIGNNLPFAAGVLSEFLADGGRLFINVPVRLPNSPEDNAGNQALALLPLSGLLDFSEYPEYEPFLDLFTGSAVTPVQPLPGGATLPALKTARNVGGTYGYPVAAGTIALYEGAYTATLKAGGFVPWPGPSTVASIRSDAAVALFALPMLSDLSGQPFLVGADGDPDAPQEAVRRILAAMGFPR